MIANHNVATGTSSGQSEQTAMNGHIERSKALRGTAYQEQR
jgi:hypothetical protein